MTIQLKSSAFGSGEPIPAKHTGEGADRSPPLTWSSLPPNTRELALICDDPDAPTSEPWVHWVLYKLPPNLDGLPEGVEPTERPKQSSGAVQGKNSWNSGTTIGYRGPMPPPGHGIHHYYFRLYALDAPMPDEPGLSKADLLRAMSGHVLAEGQLMGTYQR